MKFKSHADYGLFPEVASKLDILRVALNGQINEQFWALVNRKSLEAYDLGLDLCVGELTYRNGGWFTGVMMVEPDAQPPAYDGRWTRYLTSQRTPEIDAAVALWRQNNP